ncbi:MAG: hypothetical protein K2X47_09490 [Bdellovibrionales bacterium]|nr:hypothetical protein [Bdellovibrionales bacterium]
MKLFLIQRRCNHGKLFGRTVDSNVKSFLVAESVEAAKPKAKHENSEFTRRLRHRGLKKVTPSE